MVAIYEQTSEKKNNFKSTDHLTITISIPHEFVNNLYTHALQIHQADSKTYGFDKGTVPVHYLKKNFYHSFTEHNTAILLTHYAHDIALTEIQKKNGLAFITPWIDSCLINPENSENFFTVSADINPFVQKIVWKGLKLKLPARKKYKDLDRQAETLIQQEKNKKSELDGKTVCKGDWIQIKLSIIKSRENKETLLKNHEQVLWIKISGEEIDKMVTEIFLNKSLNEEVITDSIFFNEYFSNSTIIRHYFLVKIIEIVPYNYFCFNVFQTYFNIKTNRDLLHRLIEILSFRNDITLRRETITIVLRALMQQHRYLLPIRTLSEHTKTVHKKIINNPDYLVYQSQRDFTDKIKQFACKQVGELCIADALATQENIEVQKNDVLFYMHILQRPRLRDFIYFDLPESKNGEQEALVPHAKIVEMIRREKALEILFKYFSRFIL